MERQKAKGKRQKGFPPGPFDEQLPGFLQKKGGANSGLGLPEGYFEKLADRFFEKKLAEATTGDKTAFLEKTNTGDGSLGLPDGYFDGLPDQVFEKIAASQAAFLEEIRPLGGGYALPDGYFEKLPVAISEKTGGKLAELPARRPFFKALKSPSRLAAAAAVAALLAAVGIFFNQKGPDPLACNSACLSEKISAEDVQLYLSENLAEFSAEELASEELVGELPTAAAKRHPETDLSPADAEPLLDEMLDELSVEDLEKML